MAPQVPCADCCHLLYEFADGVVGFAEEAEDEGEDGPEFVQATFDGADGVFWRIVPLPVRRFGDSAVVLGDLAGPRVDCGVWLGSFRAVVVRAGVRQGFDVSDFLACGFLEQEVGIIVLVILILILILILVYCILNEDY